MGSSVPVLLPLTHERECLRWELILRRALRKTTSGCKHRDICYLKNILRRRKLKYSTLAMTRSRQTSLPQHPMTAEESSYRQSIIDEFQFLTFRGIAPAGNAISLPLRDIFIDLIALADVPDEADTYGEEERRLLAETRERLRGDASGEQELVLQLDNLRLQRWRAQHQRDHGSLPRRRELRSERPISGGVILGDPGAGKSTLLQFLALCAAAGLRHEASISGFATSLLRHWDTRQPPLPIFVPLAAYDDYLRRTRAEISLEEFLPIYYEKWRGQAGLKPLFDGALAAGRGLLLLDGLDEVLDRATRTLVAEQVAHLVRRHRAAGNGWVVTSRIFGYREAPLAGDFAHFTLLDLGPRQLERFAQKWCLEFEVWAAGGRNSTALRRAAEETQALLFDVQSNASVRALATNPLLITMLAILRRQVGKLPDRRVDLYDRYIRTLIDNRETTRSPGARHQSPERLDPHTVLTYLMDLSLWLQRSCPSGCAQRAELESTVIEIALRQEGYEPAQTTSAQRLRVEQMAERFLREMRHIAGLLAERGRGTFGFLHLTFQEFLAGRALARMSAEERWRIIVPVLHDQRWREPLLLCAGWLAIVEGRNEQVAAFTRQILQAASRDEPLLHRDLLLGAAIAADDLSLPRVLLDEIYARLQELLDNPVPSIRRQAAEGIAQLARVGLESALELLQGRIQRTPPDPELLRGLSVLLPTTRGAALRQQLVQLLSSAFSGSFEADAREDLDKALLQVAAPLVGIDDAIFRHSISLWSKWPRWHRQEDLHAVMRDALRERVRASLELRRAILVKACTRETGVDESTGASTDELREITSQIARTDAIMLLAPLVEEDEETRRCIASCLEDSDADIREQALRTLTPYLARDPGLIAWIKAELDLESLGRDFLAALAPMASEAEIREKLIVAADNQNYKGARAAAVEALGGLAATDDEVRALLVRKLHDDEHVVTDAALQALAPLASRDSIVREAIGEFVTMGWLFDESAAEVLVPQLGVHPDVRPLLLPIFNEQSDRALAATISSLSGLSRVDAEFRAILLKLLEHTSWTVQYAATLALKPAARNPEVRTALLARLRAKDEGLAASAVDALADLIPEDDALRKALRDLLPGASDSLCGVLLRVLEPGEAHNPWRLRTEGITEAFSNSMTGEDESSRETRQALLTDLRSDDPACRMQALTDEKLRWWVSPDAELRAAVLRLVEDPEPELRRRALFYLVRGRRETNVTLERELRQAVLAELRTPSRWYSSSTIPRFGVAGTTGLFRNASRMPHSEDDLSALCASLIAPTVTEDAEALEAIREYIGQASQTNLSALLTKLGSRELTLQLAAPIIARLNDPNVEVRVWACNSLSPLVAEDAVCTALHARILDEESIVRIAAMQVLTGAVERQQEIEHAVRSNLRHPDVNVQLEALRALGGLSINLEEELLAICADLFAAEDYSLRRDAVELLAGHLPYVPGLLPYLLPWLAVAEEIRSRGGDRSWEVDQALKDGLKALLERHPESSDEIAAALSILSLNGRCIAATALVEQPGGAPPRLWARLRAMLFDGRDWEHLPTRLMIAARLIELRDEKLLPAASEAALAAFDFGNHPWIDLPRTLPRIRKLAASALGRLQSGPPHVRHRLVKALHEEPDAGARDAIYQALLRLSASGEEAIKESIPTMQTSRHEGILIAHLSDLHFSELAQAEIWSSQLVADLVKELGCERLDGLILSGDITHSASPEEFRAAEAFIETLRTKLSIPKAHLAIVPGNHDVSWKRTRSAYRSQRRKPGQKLRDGSFIDHGELIELRNEKKYALRFADFAAFYKRLTSAEYSCNAEAQWTLTRFVEPRILILGLNSSWQIDHHFRDRISIHPQALSRALDAIQADLELRAYRKIAVWHHPVHSTADDRIKDLGFLERLSVAGFEISLHGHIHKAELSQYCYDLSPAGRRIDIVCAGTFGAPTHEWVPGYPLQYNLLRFQKQGLIVETRRREQPNGAWKPDARWLKGPGADPAPRYSIPLRV